MMGFVWGGQEESCKCSEGLGKRKRMNLSFLFICSLFTSGIPS